MNFARSFNEWRRFRETCQELNRLSGRELEDIGFNRGVLASAAIDEARTGTLTNCFDTGQFLPRPDRIDSQSLANLGEQEHLQLAAMNRNLGPVITCQQAARFMPDQFTACGQVVEILDRNAKIEQFVSLMHPLGLVEVARTGVAALCRGAKAM